LELKERGGGRNDEIGKKRVKKGRTTEGGIWRNEAARPGEGSQDSHTFRNGLEKGAKNHLNIGGEEEKKKRNSGNRRAKKEPCRENGD